MESKGLKTWIAVKKYLNLYHHQTVKEDIELKTVEGMPIDTIENELKALEIIVKKLNIRVRKVEYSKTDIHYHLCFYGLYSVGISKEKYDLLKEILLWAKQK